MTPASPFVSPQQPHPLHHQQQRHNNSSSSNSSASSRTSNNNNTTNSHHPPHSGAVASRFSPPLQNSHSQALPGRHLAAGGGAAHPLQAVQQHQQQQTYHPHSLAPHSRPSLPLSPNPSPHQAGPQYSQPFSQAVEYDVLRPPLVPEQLPPHISPAGILSGAVSAEDLDWHLPQSFQYPTLDVVVSPTTQSSWGEEHTQRMTPPEAGDASASGSTHRHPPMDPGSATTHRFHSTHPHSPTQPQSLRSEHLDPTAVTAAAATTMMHSVALEVQPDHRPHLPQQEAPQPRASFTNTCPFSFHLV